MEGKVRVRWEKRERKREYTRGADNTGERGNKIGIKGQEAGLVGTVHQTRPDQSRWVRQGHRLLSRIHKQCT